jgi:Rps23 Pro-64 3,4-dihydroxylase Tpa1-like proline 4-hydroxylase
MKEKVNKPKSKSVAKSASVRVHLAAKERAALLLLNANKKKLGRKIKFEDLFELALGLVTDEHLKQLQERSLTHEDRKEILRQKYISARGQISKDEFTGFMMTADFQDFLNEQGATDSSGTIGTRLSA